MVYSKCKAIAVLLVISVLLSISCSCSSSDVQVSPKPTTATTTFSVTDTSQTTVITSATTTTTSSTTTTTTTTTATTKRSKTTQTSTTTTTARPTTPPTSSQKGYSIQGVPVIHQMPDYPTGCETVSAVMALRYWGEDISVEQFVEKYLPKDNHFYWDNGKKYGPNPYEYFIGDPRSTHSYGCLAPVIEKALANYFGSNDRVLNTTGESLEKLCESYISKDMPVLLWVTIGMIDTKTSDLWLLEDGTLFEWPENEHCMVLIGYDKNYYYFNDPYRGTVKQYAKWLVEKRYQQLGKQSLVITD